MREKADNKEMSSDDELSNEDFAEEESVDDSNVSPDLLDLIDAVLCNNATAVQRALRNGANVNGRTMRPYGSTPLMNACKAGYAPIVRILLDAGALRGKMTGIGLPCG